MIALLLAAAIAQPSPIDIPKAELPKRGHCVVCEANGSDHGEEKVVAGVRYQGKSYFFCHAGEVAKFKADPASFLPPVLPRPAPKLDLKDTKGMAWNEAALKGRVVLVDFWATWCGPCKKMKPMLFHIREKFQAEGFELLSVSIDEKRSALDEHLKKNPFKNPVLHDDRNAWSEWGVKVVPSLFLVKDGQIVNQWRGEVKSKTPIEAAIREALKK